MVEHLHDIKVLQINNFNSLFNSCNNLQGLSGRDNILWMIVASKTHLLYIWLQSGSGDIVDHLNLKIIWVLNRYYSTTRRPGICSNGEGPEM